MGSMPSLQLSVDSCQRHSVLRTTSFTTRQEGRTAGWQVDEQVAIGKDVNTTLADGEGGVENGLERDKVR